jgi:hypothetical protein
MFVRTTGELETNAKPIRNAVKFLIFDSLQDRGNCPSASGGG